MSSSLAARTFDLDSLLPIVEVEQLQWVRVPAPKKICRVTGQHDDEEFAPQTLYTPLRSIGKSFEQFD